MSANWHLRSLFCFIGSHDIILPGCVWNSGTEDDVSAASLSRRRWRSTRWALPPDHTEQTRPGATLYSSWASTFFCQQPRFQLIVGFESDSPVLRENHGAVQKHDTYAACHFIALWPLMHNSKHATTAVWFKLTSSFTPQRYTPCIYQAIYNIRGSK